jgi:uncharacterized protein
VIIDFHTHVFAPKLIANRSFFITQDHCFATLFSNPKARLSTADDLIVEMDACGVDKSVILNIGWLSHDLCVETNNYILESASRYPGRLIPFVGIQPRAGANAIREIERCVAAGARGVGEIRPDVQGLDLGDTHMQQFVESLMANKLILLSHADEPVGHTYHGKGGATPGTFYPFIGAYPELKLVLAHWGGGLPFYSLMPEVKKALKNVWFDSAASPYLYRPEIYKQVAELSGVDKILFGSDFPLLSPRRGVDEVKSLGLPVSVSEKILGANAADLLELIDA